MSSAALSFLTSAADLYSRRGKEVAGPRFHGDAVALQVGGEAKREILRHHDPSNASLAQQSRDKRRQTPGRLNAFTTQLFLVAAERQDATNA